MAQAGWQRLALCGSQVWAHVMGNRGQEDDLELAVAHANLPGNPVFRTNGRVSRIEVSRLQCFAGLRIRSERLTATEQLCSSFGLEAPALNPTAPQTVRPFSACS